MFGKRYNLAAESFPLDKSPFQTVFGVHDTKYEVTESSRFIEWHMKFAMFIYTHARI